MLRPMNEFTNASESTKRRNPHLFGVPVQDTRKAAASERDLHDEIEAELKRRSWYYVHSRMDRATTTQKGVTDFIIAAPGGVSFWIEAKRMGGKLTPEQTVTRHVLLGLNHYHKTVFSFKEFFEFVGGGYKLNQPCPRATLTFRKTLLNDGAAPSN